MAIEEMKGVVIEVIVIGIAGIGTGKAYGLRNRVRIACTTGVVSEKARNRGGIRVYNIFSGRNGNAYIEPIAAYVYVSKGFSCHHVKGR